jgi:hypothetical protein
MSGGFSFVFLLPFVVHFVVVYFHGSSLRFMSGAGTRRALVLAAALALLATPRVGLRVHAASPPCAIDGVERIVAIGDVHGAYDRLVAILRTAEIVDARLRWAAGKTHLVQLGDVVDRGPDSRKVLDLLQVLEKDAARAGGAVHAMLGNHEIMRMLGDLRFATPGEYAAFVTARSEEIRQRFIESAPKEEREPLLKETPLGSIEMRVAFGRDGAYGKWLRGLNGVVKINGVLFVHGGISPAVAALSCDAINETVRRDLTSDLDKTRAAPLSSLTAREDGPFWYRGLAQPETPAAQVDDLLAKQGARAIVIGHTVASARITPRLDGRVFQIDTGMQPAYAPTGAASALEISRGVFTAIYEDRRDVLVTPPADPVTAAPAARH